MTISEYRFSSGSDFRNIDAKLENRTKRIIRLETLLRESGKGETELKAELAKLKAENRSLKVTLSKISCLTSRVSIAKSSLNHDPGRFVTENLAKLHLHLELQSPIQVLLLLQAPMPHHHKHHQGIHRMKNVGYSVSKNWKVG